MAENKMFAGAGKVVKRVPKWALYVSGGVLVAGGIFYFRGRSAADTPLSDTGTGSDTYADDGAVGYADSAQSSGLIIPSDNGGAVVSGELNTDIPSSTLDVFSGVISDLAGVITGGQPDYADVLATIAAAGSSPGTGAANPGGVVTAGPTAGPNGGKKTKTPTPLPKLEAGYHRGTTVDMGKGAKKSFPGALGWVRVASGDTGAKHWIDIHVRYCNKLERWRVRPNAKGSPWNKTFSGSRPNLCK